jgi:hypothetical protein
MKWRFLAILLPPLLGAATLAIGGENQGRRIPHPLPSHPGNIFVAGERVIVLEPPGQGDSWRVMDYDGNRILEGLFSNGRADLGQLPVGYYQLFRRAMPYSSNMTTIGVLEPLKAATPEDSPIGIDVAMAWFFKGERMNEVANLCALAGMNRVRDRLTWEQMEPKRGEFAGTNQYDEALDVQRAAGLKVLQVSHISASWANPVTKRFPPDLRDSYKFYRALAQRWAGRLEALEPWNEADIEMFGGHTGSEMASLQKAAYLGIKAGNPKLIACQNVFAIHREATLGDFNENAAWPYFDTFNLHHYDPLNRYPQTYADFRAVSAGKPLWVSECSVHVKWQGDERLKELSPEDLRLQSERVTKTYVLALHQGAAAIFYFMLPHYTERQLQFGVLRADLTPRPAFLAVAAAGRMLAGAKPLGRVDVGDKLGQGYFFRAMPDGKAADVMVIWAKEETSFDLPSAALACFDHLGRRRPLVGKTLKIGPQPCYVIFANGAHPRLKPPPDRAKLLSGEPSKIVLQALVPVEDRSLEKSAYYLPKGKMQKVTIFVYNFGSKLAKGRLTSTAPEGWAVEMACDLELAPMERKQLEMNINSPAGEWSEGRIRIAGDFGSAGQPLLSLGFVPK